MRHAATLSLLALGFIAAPAGAATFKVEGPAGEAVAGARVAVYGPPLARSLTGRSAAGPLELASGADGQVQGELPALTPRLVFVDHPDFAPFAVTGVTLGSVRLERGVRMTGLVRPARGESVVGRVCARWRMAVAEWGREIPVERCTALAADGKLDLGGLGDEAVNVEITAAAHLPSRLRWRVGEPPLEVKLEPGFLVRGRVLDPVGQGVPGALVVAQSTATTTTAADGRFELAVAALPAELRLSGDGVRARRVSVAADAAQREPVFRLEWGQQLEGNLRIEEGGEPARPLLVTERFVPPGSWPSERIPLTLDENGSYRVQLDRPGRYRLRLKADGYREEQLAEAEIAPGSVLDLGAVTLRRGAGFRCRVVEETHGEPLAGAEVRLLAQGSAVIDQIRRRASWATVSGAQGSAIVWGLEPGRYEVRVRRDGFAPRTANVEVEADRLSEGGDLVLGLGVELTGEIRTRGGSAVPEARVQLFDPAGLGIVPVAEATADPAGAYRGLVVAAGSYLAKVQGPHQQATQTIQVEAEEGRQRLDLTLPGVRLEVRLHERGEPVPAGTLVNVSAGLDPGLRQGKVIIQGSGRLAGQVERLGIPEPARTARVDDEGRAIVEDVAVGPARLEIVPLDGRSPVVRQLAVPDVARHLVDLDLASPSLGGRVSTADAGLALRARARVFDLRGLEVASDESDDDGAFLVAGLEVGRYALTVEAEGFASAVFQDLEVPAEGKVVEVTLERATEGGIEVRLTRSDGTPMSSAALVLLGEVGDTVRATWTDALGQARLEGLSPGRYGLVWTDPVAGSGASSGLEVAAGEVASFARVVSPGAELGLACPLEQFEQCAGRAVEQFWLATAEGIEIGAFLGGATTQRQFGFDGSLRLGRLSPGTYQLRVRAGKAEWRQDLRAEPGQALVLAAEVATPPAALGSP